MAELCLLTAAGDGIAPALLLTHPPPRGGQLLVNAPEGLSRLALEHRVRPSAKLRCLLLTRLTPDAAAGLPSLLLRLSSDGHGSLEVLGPPGTAAYVQACHQFVRWVHPQVFVRDLVPGDARVAYSDADVALAPVWSGAGGEGGAASCAWCALRAAFPDEAAHASAVVGEKRSGDPLAAPAARLVDSDSSSGDDDSSDDSEPAAPPPPLPVRPAAPAAPLSLPRTLGRQLSACAPGGCGCAARPLPRIDSDRAEEGTNPVFVRPPPPPLCSPLPSPAAPPRLLGYAVLLLRGRECLLVDADGAATAAAAACDHSSSHVPTALVADLSSTPQSSASSHPDAPPRLLCRGGTGALGHLASAKTTALLHAALPALFPLPACVDADEPAAPAPAVEPAVERGGCVQGRLMLRLRFLGGGAPPQPDASLCPPALDFKTLTAELLADRPRFVTALAAASAAAAAATSVAPVPVPPPPAQQLAPSNQSAAALLRARLQPTQSSHTAVQPIPPSLLPSPQLIFLGTGCAEPSQHRAASALFLLIPGRGTALIEAGEGCAGAAIRALGRSAARAAFSHLRCVFVSHPHADHMLGLPGALSAAAEAGCEQPPLVVGPASAAGWLGRLPPAACRPAFVYLPCTSLAADGAPPGGGVSPAAASCLASLGLSRAATVPVQHCADAHALLLAGGDGMQCAPWSLAFSGDGRPSGRFARLAAGVGLLVHEATFEQAHESHARSKRHCTVEEALGVAAQAGGVGHTVLTHFSQRTVRCVTLPEGADAERTSVAFDGMRVDLGAPLGGERFWPVVTAALASPGEEPEGGEE